MTTAPATTEEKSVERQQLERDGFCVFENVIDPDLLQRTRAMSDRLLDAQSAQHFQQQKSTGSLISVYEDPGFADLIAAPGALQALGKLGYDSPRFASGFVISKPAHSPPLFWHQDWWGWNEPISYQWTHPPQAFLMYYLVDTSRANGCLRLIPGTHRKRHAMHDAVPDAHTDELRRVVDPAHPAYQSIDGEVDVPVRAGSVVIGDSRMLHSAHANTTDRRRTVITLWYYPAWDELPEGVRAYIAAASLPESWHGEALSKLGSLRAAYDGKATPTSWNRIPGPEFR